MPSESAAVSYPSWAIRFAWCAAAVAAACSHAAPPAAPAPQSAAARAAADSDQADLSGDWAVQLSVQGATPITGLLRLTYSGDGYNGNLQLDIDTRPFFVRSVRVQGDHVVMIVQGTDGDARVEGNMRSATEFEGIYTSRTLNGRFTMSHR